MKIKHIISNLITVVISVTSASAAFAQGTVNFDYPWAYNGVGYFSLAQFNDFSFGVGNRIWPYDNMVHVGAIGPDGYPHDATPYVAFNNTLGTPQHVVFAWTNAASMGQTFLNGGLFGLVSVDLADPVAPSLSPIGIVFNGYRADGSMVTQTFNTPGSGSSFQTYYFDSSFRSGLVRVEMPSAAWAMDNLVFVPEPGAVGLLAIGLLAFIGRKVQASRKL